MSEIDKQPPAPVEYYHRYEKAIRNEVIYGEPFLRWAYESRLGWATVEAVAKRLAFSRFYGWRMKRKSTRRRIAPFIEKYGLDPSEFADEIESYGSFNDFFVRKLKPAARPIDPHPRSVVFPADGRHLGFAEAGALSDLYAKGQRLDLSALLGSDNLAARHRAGAMVISRLCPVDYHWFHFPVAGIPGTPRPVNGALYSVSPIAMRRKIGILSENKRILTCLRTESMGEALLLEIGATNVGSIVQTHDAGESARKGGEKGYFEFGGSMTIVLFEPGAVRLDEDLLEQSAAGRELYARMGDRMGEAAG